VNVGGTHTGHLSWEGAYFAPNNNPEIDDARDGEYLTDYLFRKAEEYIRQHRDGDPSLPTRPFALSFGHRRNGEARTPLSLGSAPKRRLPCRPP
jgi:hypothetical protein